MHQTAQRALVDEEGEADAVGGEAELALHGIGDVLRVDRLGQRQADALCLPRSNLQWPDHRTCRGDRVELVFEFRRQRALVDRYALDLRRDGHFDGDGAGVHGGVDTQQAEREHHCDGDRRQIHVTDPGSVRPRAQPRAADGLAGATSVEQPRKIANDRNEANTAHATTSVASGPREGRPHGPARVIRFPGLRRAARADKGSPGQGRPYAPSQGHRAVQRR